MSEAIINTNIYSKPIEIDGRWVVTITDSINPEFEDRKDFVSKEKAEEFIQKKTKPDKNKSYVKPPFRLTEQQQEFIRANWDKKSQQELFSNLFPNKSFDGRSNEVRVIKTFIANLNSDGVPIKPEPEPIRNNQILPGLKLQDHQKATIDSLLQTENPPTAKEVFKMLFPDLEYTFYAKEYRAIVAYIKAQNEEAIDIWEEPVEDRRYKAPLNYGGIIGLVNRYVSNPVDPSRAMYDPNKIKPNHEKNLKALFSYLQTNTFMFQASQYDKKADRELFESTFVRHVHDKATDLLPEEVDTYIAIAAETVKTAQLERDIIKQQKIRDETLDGDDDKENRAKLSMSLVESIKTMQSQHAESKKHRQKLLESVAGARKERIESKSNQNDNLGNIIAMWLDEKKRKELIELAKKEHLEDAAEMERLTNLDDTWVLIAGMTKSEAIGGLQ